MSCKVFENQLISTPTWQKKIRFCNSDSDFDLKNQLHQHHSPPTFKRYWDISKLVLGIKIFDKTVKNVTMSHQIFMTDISRLISRFVVQNSFWYFSKHGASIKFWLAPFVFKTNYITSTLMIITILLKLYLIILLAKQWLNAFNKVDWFSLIIQQTKLKKNNGKNLKKLMWYKFISLEKGWRIAQCTCLIE